MASEHIALRKTAVALRKQAKTYSEIQRVLGRRIPKSTLSYWFREISLSKKQQRRLQSRITAKLLNAHAKALEANRRRRAAYVKEVRQRVKHLAAHLWNKNTAKIALALLYLGEGSKTARGSLMFGNSDPATIRLFLELLRFCYSIDEKRFRCTVQCRADQNTRKLESFWSHQTKIPRAQFYRSRIDPRTLGRPSRKQNYFGVCRIDYFSGDIFLELTQIIAVLTRGL